MWAVSSASHFSSSDIKEKLWKIIEFPVITNFFCISSFKNFHYWEQIDRIKLIITVSYLGTYLKRFVKDERLELYILVITCVDKLNKDN